MPFFLQDPFNFNIEISVSWCGCRYHDPAGFMPRTLKIAPGAPALLGEKAPDKRGSASIRRVGLLKGRTFGKMLWT